MRLVTLRVYKKPSLKSDSIHTTMMFKIYLFLGLVTAFAAEAANVLVIFPIASRSHQILGDEIVRGLLKAIM